VLSDNDRKTLLEVERRFLADDPELARLFHEQLREQPAGRAGSNGKIAVLAAMLFSGFLLLAGFPGGALACVITTGVACAMWFFLDESDPERPHPPR
jgi:Protein of unknown function (DUF3040)